jgi:hypothetical protein
MMDIEHVKNVKATYEQSLLAKANVVGVGVGLYAQEKGVDAEPCIIVSVRQKVPLDQLALQDRIPSQLEGVRVRVQATGEIKAF